MKVIGVIPARFGSTRLPGKPLIELAGKPMIQHVYERARQARRLDRLMVATDDERIAEVVRGFGGEAILTRKEHRSGTERIAEVAAQTPAEIYVNIQGDEPLIEPATIDAVAEAIAGDSAVQVATLCVPISGQADVMNPNVVKVVVDFDGFALYFSRAPIPWVREESAAALARHLKHLGLYAYRRDALLEFPALPPGELERVEQLEQLRWLENGYRICVAETTHDSISVDVPEDIERVERALRGDS